MACRDFSDRPLRMFRNQSVIRRRGDVQCGKVIGRAGIAECDADIAQKAWAFDALDR